MTTRREVITKCGLGIAGIIAAGKVPAAVVKSMLGMGGIKQVGAIEKPTAADYIQDGLIAMWDGIENAGCGVHDDSATIWKDLSPSGYDLVLKNGAHFDSNSLITANRNELSALLDMRVGYVSIEICAFFDASRNSSGLVCFGNSIDADRMMSCSTDMIQIYNNNNHILLDSSVQPRSTWSGVHESVTNRTAYINGKTVTGRIRNNNWGTTNGNFGLSGSSNYRYWNFVGNYYNVRLYNRALTTDEIAHNYKVDKERFGL